jgi:WD40 repeat protein
MLRWWVGPLVAAALITAAASQQSPAPPALSIQSGHFEQINAVAASRDGAFVLTASDDYAVVIWDSLGRQIRRFEGHEVRVTHIRIDSQNRAVTVSADGAIRIWNPQTAAAPRRDTGLPRERGPRPDILERVQHEPLDIALDPLERYLALASRSGVEIWEYPGLRHRSLLQEEGFLKPAQLSATAVAFLPDGRLLCGDSASSRVRLWSIVPHKFEREFRGHRKAITAVAVAPDGRSFASGSVDSTVLIWSMESEQPVRTITRPSAVRSVSINGAGQLLVVDQDSVTLWSLASGERLRAIRTLKRGAEVGSFDPTGAYVLQARFDVALRARASDGEIVTLFQPEVDLPRSVALAAKQLFVGSLNGIWQWDLERGVARPVLSGHRSYVNDLAATSDGRNLVSAGGADSTVIVWDLATRKPLLPPMNIGRTPTSIAVDRFGRVAVGTVDAWIGLWHYRPSHLRPGTDSIYWIPADSSVWSVGFSGDGRLLVGATSNGFTVWDLESCRPHRRIRDAQDCRTTGLRDESREAIAGAREVLFTPRLPYVIGANWASDTGIRAWDGRSGVHLRRYPGHEGGIGALAIDAIGDRFFSAGYDKLIRQWDLDRRTVIATYEGAGSYVEDLAVTPDGSLVVALSRDGAVRVWNGSTSRLLATLTVGWPSDRSQPIWAVVAPDGRFDTNRLEGVRGLWWVADDDAMNAMPLEVFMRDFYTPGVLAARIAGKAYERAETVTAASRVQPGVSVQVGRCSSETSACVVHVRAWSRDARGRAGFTMRSGVHDVRLFRNGHLVAQWPSASTMTQQDDIAAWRASSALALDPRGEWSDSVIVRVAPGVAADTVEFSAYAFNSERIKSETAVAEQPLVPGRPATRRAYVIAVGVGVDSSGASPLSSAVGDVSLARRTLGPALAASGSFDSVITVALLSRPLAVGVLAGEAPATPDTPPTRRNIRTVLDILAGRPVTREARAALGSAATSVSRVAPQDLVILTFTMHGYMEGDRFALVPYRQGGIGQGAGGDQRDITSDDLGEWLRGIDTDHLVLVLSACYAQAAVTTAGFRPGPMGDRGFGQLAYDLGLRVLVAAEGEARALSDHTDLARALLQEAPDSLRARGDVTLTDLLRYAADRVPQVSSLRGARGGTETVQTPTLFDFRRRLNDVVLYRRR